MFRLMQRFLIALAAIIMFAVFSPFLLWFRLANVVRGELVVDSVVDDDPGEDVDYGP